MKREQLSKGEPINCSGSRSRTTKRAAPPREGAPTRAKIVICKIPSFGEHRGDLRSISGSDSPDFSNLLIDQVANVLGREPDDFDEWGRQTEATLAAIVGIEPRDEIEGMLVAQLIASHNAATECYRHAMLRNQTFDGRHENLKQATKLSRTYAALTEALDRHRGKGQQRITVEHVHVHAGAQAIVGAVTSRGGGDQQSGEPTNAIREVTHEPGTPMRSPDPERELMPVAGGAGKTEV
jgi:hypothetical protein